MNIDLHIHSVYSDGNLTPQQIVDVAIEKNLLAISITDHDNIKSFKIAQDYLDQISEEKGKQTLELIPGVEINTLWNGKEIHILGYYMDLNSQLLQDLLAYQQHARSEQTTLLIENLNKKAKIKITKEDVIALVQEEGSIGRPHIAKAIANVGGARTIIEAYNKFINDKSPIYVKRKTVSPHEAVETIYEAGGIPVIAHPYDLEFAEDFVKDLMSYGLRGIEAYHRKHSPAMIEYYSSMAEKYDLILTGGSDCHGHKSAKQLFLGNNLVPEWILHELKKEKSRLEIASN